MKNIFFALTFACVGCSFQNKNTSEVQFNQKSNSIINGVPVTTGNALAKSVVGLMFKNPVWYTGCTGSVLGDRFILTAAHCLASAHADALMVNFSLNTPTYEQQSNPKTAIADADIEKAFVVRKVRSFLINPKYNKSGDHDLAIILLEDKIPADAVPVTLLPDQYLDVANYKTTLDDQPHPITLIGFGVISENPATDTDVLRMTSVPGKFENQFVVTDQTHGSGGCNGDSGGPAFFEIGKVTYQVGVTHGPNPGSRTCHEEGQWMNPGLDKDFLETAQKTLLAQ